MKKLLLLLIFMSCQSVEKKEKGFNLKNHLKSNDWCAYTQNLEKCFAFSDSKLIMTENGIEKDIFNVTYNQENDSLVIIKVIGGQESRKYFSMKSRNTLYYYQSDENKMLVLTRIE